MNYDFIITGGGCSGLSLLVRMIQSQKFRDKKILLIDKELKKANDRTWCFWETTPGFFENLVYKKWDHLYFHGLDFSTQLDLQPYQYKMIRGADFYQHVYTIIDKCPEVEVKIGEVQSIENKTNGVDVIVDGTIHSAPYVFNSLILAPPDLTNYHSLQQHFKGWFIKSGKSVFSSQSATLMDFRISQKHGTAFVYVLPFQENNALIEYTLFTRDLLAPAEYDEVLQKYISEHLQLTEYSIDESEFGVIPMTNFPFPETNGRIVNIGTAGGQTKASTGYTFQFIQKQAKKIIDSLIETGAPMSSTTSNTKRFSFYDSVLLHVLDKKKLGGKELFTDLFKNGDPQTVLKFLDNETTLTEDLQVMKRLPKGVFANAALKELFG